jgi:hypothetical protein
LSKHNTSSLDTLGKLSDIHRYEVVEKAGNFSLSTD